MLRKLLVVMILLLVSCRGNDKAFNTLQEAVLSNDPGRYIEAGQNYFRAFYTLEELRKADSSRIAYRTKIGSSVHVFYIEAYRNEHPDTFIFYLAKLGKEYKIINGNIKGLEAR